MRAGVVLLLLFLAGCTRVVDVSWRIERTAGARAVDGTIHEESCAGRTVYSESWRVGAGAMGGPLPALAPGRYCFRAIARNDVCEGILAGETIADIPTDGADVVTILRAEVTRGCPRCDDGICQPVSEDAGVDAAAPVDAADIDAVIVTDASPFDARSLDAVSLDAWSLDAADAGSMDAADAADAAGRRDAEGTDARGDAGLDAGPSIDPIVGVSAGSSAACALRASGEVVCWGRGIRVAGGVSAPFVVDGVSSAVDLAAAGGGACAASASLVRCWGTGREVLGATTGTFQYPPTTSLDFAPARIVDLSCGATACCVALEGQGLRCWGVGRNFVLGDGMELTTATPSTLVTDVYGPAINDGAGFGVSASGSLNSWGGSPANILGRTAPSYPDPNVGEVVRGVQAVSAGVNHACLRTSAGGVSCWGDNTFLQLGRSGVSSAASPLPVTLAAAELVSAGTFASCAVTATALQCWGRATVATDGSAGSGDPRLPTAVPVPGRVTSVAVGGSFACAASDRERVYCWGENSTAIVPTMPAGTVLVPTEVSLP